MKKILLFTAALAALLSAASCQKEEMGAVEDGNGNVTFTIQTPEDAVTKAIGDGTNVDIVYYEIYKAENKQPVGEPLVDATVEMSNKAASLTLNLLEDQDYVALFWAQVNGKNYYNVGNLRNVVVNYADVDSNLEERAAFYQKFAFSTENAVNETVTLVRPFAQLNIGTTLESLDMDYHVDVLESSVTVANPAYIFDVNAGLGKTATDEAVVFNQATKPDEALIVNDVRYEYVAMNYILVDGSRSTVNVDFSIVTDKGTVTKTVTDVPVAQNYRTNLLGNLLTKETKIEIVVDERFADEDLDGGKFGVINGQYYVKAETSDEFYAAVADENVDIVILTDDVVLDTPVTRAEVVNALTVSAGKDLTIDLAGHTLSWTSSNPGDAMIMNNGELNLVGEGKILFTYTGEADASYSKGNYTIVNNNKLTIDGPTVENATAKMSHASYAVQNAGELHIKSGKVLNTNNYAIRLWIGASKETSVVMDGGVVEGTRAIWAQLPSSGAEAPVHNFTMNGGQLIGTGESEEYKLAIYSYNYGNSLENVSFTFNGGVVEGDIALTGGKNKTTIEALNINGGTFIGGVYSYGDDALAAAAITIKGGQFVDLSAMCYLNDEVEVYALANDITLDADNTIAVAKGKTWNLDLNGKTITAESDETSGNRNLFDANGGTLTIKNGTIEYAHVGANMGWNSSTNLFNITAGGVLNLEGVTANNRGGSDMAFVAHLNNWGEATLNVESCHLESTYIAVRVFNSGHDMNNVTIKNSTLKGKYCFWVHNYKAAGDSAGDDSTLNFDILNGTNTFVPAEGKAPILYGFNNPIYYDTCGNIYVAEGVGMDAEGSYMIANATGMFWFANEVNVNKNSFSGKTVKLAADIDLANAVWTPVGQTGATTFNGVFDGQGKTISNLNVNSDAQTGEYYSSGLFGWVETHTDGNGQIKNVKINGATVVGHHNCGALVGYITEKNAIVENCHVSNATISCTYANGDADGDKAGALIGNATNATKVNGCSATDCTVSAGRDSGQLIGAAKADNVTDCSATNVTVYANGTGTGANIRNEVIGRLL